MTDTDGSVVELTPIDERSSVVGLTEIIKDTNSVSTALPTALTARRSSIFLEEFDTVFERNLSVPCFIIYPNSTLKSVWDLVIMSLLFYLVIWLPIRIAFYEMGSTIDPVDIVVDCLFLCDIVMSFLTAYEDKDGKLVTDFSLIAKRYLQGWFALDFVATLPLYLIANSSVVGRAGFLARVPRLLRLFRLSRLLKLVRAYRFRIILEWLASSPAVHPGTFRVVKLFVGLVLLGHFSSCLWYAVGTVDTLDSDSWVIRLWNRDDPILEENGVRRYIIGMYYCVTTITTSGFGDVSAKTVPELVFSTLLVVTGSTLFAYTTATISSIIMSMDTLDNKVRQKMGDLYAFIEKNNLRSSPNLARSVVQTMKEIYGKPALLCHRTANVLKQLPPKLRIDVAQEMYSELVTTSHFFRQFDHEEHKEFIESILLALTPTEYPKGETIVEFGQTAKYLYLIDKGTVHAVSSTLRHIVYSKFGPGMSFGELPMFLTQRWLTTMVAATDCNLLLLPCSQLIRLLSLQTNRSCLEILVNTAKNRFQKLRAAKKTKAFDVHSYSSSPSKINHPEVDNRNTEQSPDMHRRASTVEIANLKCLEPIFLNQPEAEFPYDISTSRVQEELDEKEDINEQLSSIPPHRGSCSSSSTETPQPALFNRSLDVFHTDPAKRNARLSEMLDAKNVSSIPVSALKEIAKQIDLLHESLTAQSILEQSHLPQQGLLSSTPTVKKTERINVQDAKAALIKLRRGSTAVNTSFSSSLTSIHLGEDELPYHNGTKHLKHPSSLSDFSLFDRIETTTPPSDAYTRTKLARLPTFDFSSTETKITSIGPSPDAYTF